MNRPPAETSFATNVADLGELAQAVGTANAAVDNAQKTAGKGDPAMAGFGSGVHLYLNQTLTLIFSKTTTLLAANMVLVSLLLSTRASSLLTLNFFYIGSVFFFALSAIVSTSILFPRLHHHDSGGLLFWRAILLSGTAEDYYASIKALDKLTVEEEYAKDNWHISKTIRYKDALLRAAITFFICGMAFAVFGVVIPIILTAPHH